MLKVWSLFKKGLMQAAIGLMHDDVLLISFTTKPHIQNANVLPEDRNWKEYQHEMWKKRAETIWERGVVVKLISKMSSCIRPIYSDWVCTAVMSKWRHERSSRLIRNLSNCEREAWKKFRLQRDSNPWPLRYRCSALPTELWSHNCWEQVNFSGSIMPLRVIQHYSDWVCTAVMSKWRHERSSRLIRNLSNCEREAWKKFRLQRDSNPWPLRYRCSNFFQASLSQLLKLRINREDLSWRHLLITAVQTQSL